MALVIKTFENKIPFTDKEIYDNSIYTFTPSNPRGCVNLTIPISTKQSQRWYGDIAKTIIYALLQEYDKTTNRRRT